MNGSDDMACGNSANIEKIPMVNVTARILDQTGRPVARARITMRLTNIERYCGLIVPREVTQYTDANGVAVLRVWPNELGTECSEYMVTIMYGDASVANGGCGGCGSPTSAMSQRFRVVVPNCDCNLFDITDLPPYEQRGSGQVITSEVAAYAAQAANAADRANKIAQSVNAVQGNVEGLVQRADAANSAAQTASANAQKQAQRAQAIIDSVDGAILNFETSVIERTEKTANRLTTNATACIRQAEEAALTSIENRTGDALTEISKRGSEMQQAALEAIAAKRESALLDLDEVARREREEFREEARLFGEDFEALTERAETAAKRAGCSAASAANSATRACLCAERAENAATGVEKAKDEAVAAANKAQTSEQCAEAAATRAVNAADSAMQSADFAAGSAKAALEAVKAADCSAELARQQAAMAHDAQVATRKDKERAEEIAANMEQAIHDKAVELLTPQIVSDAIDAAIIEADTAAQCANEALEMAKEEAGNAEESAQKSDKRATESARQANYAKVRADRAEKARDAAGEFAQAAAAEAQKLIDHNAEHSAAQYAIVDLAGQHIRLSDDFTKFQLGQIEKNADLQGRIDQAEADAVMREQEVAVLGQRVNELEDDAKNNEQTETDILARLSAMEADAAKSKEREAEQDKLTLAALDRLTRHELAALEKADLQAAQYAELRKELAQAANARDQREAESAAITIETMDRMTRLELALLANWPAGGATTPLALPPWGYTTFSGAQVAPPTIVRPGVQPPAGAAIGLKLTEIETGV